MPFTTGQSTLHAPSANPAKPGDGMPGMMGMDAGVVRPSSTTPTGYDPSYIQNLATSTGGNFMRPSGGVLNFNPLGNLNDIPSNPLGGGNAPLFGLPQTLQQNAQANAPPPPSPTVGAVTPPTPITSGTPNTAVPGSNNNLFFGPTGRPQPMPGSPLWNAIMQAYQQKGWNFTSPPNLAPIYEQFGFMFSPGQGIIINTPSVGGT